MAGNEQGKARKGKSTKHPPKWMSSKIAILLVACASVGVFFVLFHKAPTSSSSLADWVKQQDFDPVTPFRSDLTPGTLLSVGNTATGSQWTPVHFWMATWPRSRAPKSPTWFLT
jgi:hypothetical protein